MGNNYVEIKSKYPIQDIIGGLVHLRREGNRYIGLCPFHGEKTPSFQVNVKTQRFKCFGCGKGGDVIDFIKEYYHLEHDSEAIQKLTGEITPVSLPEPKEITASDLDKAINVQPAPEPGQIVHKKYGAPSMRFDYRDSEGRFLYCTCRFDVKGGKIVLPYSYWQAHDGRRFWSWRGVPTPRALYGLDRLAKNKKATVVLVEGEKAADAAQRLLPHAICLTWCGGVNNVKSADFSPLKGRRLILWPDADTTHTYGPTHPIAGEVMPWEEQPGNMAMLEVYEHVKDIAARVMWLETPLDVVCGWDAADAETDGWKIEDARAFAKDRLREVEEITGYWWGRHPLNEIRPDKPEIVQDDEPDPEFEKAAQETPAPEISDAAPPAKKNRIREIPGAEVYYRPLGYEMSDVSRTLYWVFNYAKQTALCFTSSSLAREPSLFEIAPMEYWETYFHKKGGKIDLQNALSHLMEACTNAGQFNPGNMRGRGAWIDKGAGPIFNTGSFIYTTAGASVPISGFSSESSYTRGSDIKMSADIIADADARAMAAAFRNINFERTTSRYMFAGWCVLAPVCGALNWRPHVWLSGGAGTGKSWLLQNVIRTMAGEDIALFVQGNTTEAGIRQTLRNDALPVIFDEAEAEDERAGDRIKSILELARSASVQNDASTAKGSSGGKAQSTIARSMFCFSSIVVTATQDSDLSRITNINLILPSDENKNARWAQLQKDARELFTPERCRSLRTRTLRELPNILHNFQVFADILRTTLGDQRSADQIGMLLSGAWSLHKPGKITPADALNLIEKQDWKTELRDRENSDADRLLSRIREHIVKLDVTKGTVTMTIGEMIEYAGGKSGPDDAEVYAYDYNRHLGRMGLMVDAGELLVSNSSSYIKSILRGTPWAVNWHKVLIRIPGATGDKMRRFATVQARAVAIPLNTIMKDAPVFDNKDEEIPF